ncbi:hypothetical protein [Hydrogenophaga sp.]|uniref:hypothetical protein n=1 Tax=Hydrogenophaga sp. TaxID=1904254 RepID=UPI003D12B863
MSAAKHPLFLALAASALVLAPSTSIGESVLASTGKASATLELRIIIPPVMQVLENSHPLRMDAEASGDWSAEQRLVVVSNMKRGFCVTLRMSAPEVEAWRLNTPKTGGVTLNPVSDGYRLCAPRPGRYTLLLQHEFAAATTQRTNTGALRWPVQTDITAL